MKRTFVGLEPNDIVYIVENLEIKEIKVISSEVKNEKRDISDRWDDKPEYKDEKKLYLKFNEKEYNVFFEEYDFHENHRHKSVPYFLYLEDAKKFALERLNSDLGFAKKLIENTEKLIIEIEEKINKINNKTK